MTQKQSFYSSLSNRHEKKRGSVDAVIKPDRRYKHADPRQAKRQMTELTIDLNPHKSQKVSLHRNFTHRPQLLQSNNLCELREQVQQLRMQNQSLREEVKNLKSSQSQLKFQVASLKKQMLSQQQKNLRLENEQQKLQQRLKKYSEKIKQLFESLIYEKRKNAGYEDEIKVRMALSPSNLSICNSMNLRKFEQEGYKDYYNSAKRNQKNQETTKEEYSRLEKYNRLKKIGWSMQSSESSMSQGIKGGIGQSFINKY